MNCYNCPYDGKHNDICLSCKIPDEYSFAKSPHLFDYVQPTHDDGEQKQSDYATRPIVSNMNLDMEQKFKDALYGIFDLSYLEILMLKAIMNQKTLEDFAKDMSKLFVKQSSLIEHNQYKRFTRHHAFQLRKSMLKKLPDSF